MPIRNPLHGDKYKLTTQVNSRPPSPQSIPLVVQCMQGHKNRVSHKKEHHRLLQEVEENKRLLQEGQLRVEEARRQVEQLDQEQELQTPQGNGPTPTDENKALFYKLTVKNQNTLIETIKDMCNFAQKGPFHVNSYLEASTEGLFKTKSDVIYIGGGKFKNKPIDAASPGCEGFVMRALLFHEFQKVKPLEDMRIYDSLKTEVVYLRAYFRSISLYFQLKEDDNMSALEQGRMQIIQEMINALLDDEKFRHLNRLDLKKDNNINVLRKAQKDMLTDLLNVIAGDEKLRDHHARIQEWRTLVRNESYAIAIEHLENSQARSFPLKKKISAQLSKIKSAAEVEQMLRSLHFTGVIDHYFQIHKIMIWIKRTAEFPLDIDDEEETIYPKEMTDDLPYLIKPKRRDDDFSDGDSDEDDGENVPKRQKVEDSKPSSSSRQ